MRGISLFARLSVVLVATCTSWLLTLGVAQAQCAWCDEISNALIFYQETYPNSNFEPYHDTLIVVRNALGRDDSRTVRSEMTKFFTMLRKREHAINDVAADELVNFAAMVTPIQEYGISVPQPMTGP